jgi:hypothetical protein
LDISELYSRLQETQDTNRNWMDASAMAMQEVRQDILQLDSNADTQKKVFSQKLEEVQQKAQIAEEKADGTQKQIESVRQQTKDMHKSLLAMQTHSEKLTTGLENVMDRFEQLHFDLPNALDDWIRVRLKREGAGPSTVSGKELHRRRWASNGQRLRIPPVPPLHFSVPMSQSSAEDTNPPSVTPPPLPPSQSQSDFSPSKYISHMLNAEATDQSLAMGDLENILERAGQRSNSGGTRSGESMGHPSLVIRSAPLFSDLNTEDIEMTTENENDVRRMEVGEAETTT